MNSINPAEFKILVVDDDAEVVMGTTRLLAKAGYVVASAADGIAALQAMQTNPPDLLLLDRDMPRLDGLEACRRIKADPALAGCFVVLASSTYAETDDRVHGFEAGADGYLLRPIANREMLARVNGYVRLIDITRRLRVQAEELRLEKEAAARAQLGSLNLAEDSIEARRRAEDLNRQLQDSIKALSASETRFRSIIESSPVAMAINTAEGDISFLNPCFVKTFGYRREDIPTLADWWLKAYPDPVYRQQIKESWLTELGRAAQTKAPFTPPEVKIRCKDGTERHVSVSAAPLESGRAGAYLVVFHDITEAKRAANLLQQREEQTRLFMEATSDCIWNWDIGTGVVERSTGFTKIFGYPAEEIEPTIDWWINRLHADDRDRVMSTYHEAVASGAPSCSYEYRFRRRDDKYAVIKDFAFIVRDQHGQTTRSLGAMTDITAHKRAQEELVFRARLGEILLRLPQEAEQLDEKAFMQQAQEFAEDLTGSQISFIHFVNDDQATIELVTWSRRTLEKYCHAAYENHYPVKQAGIWADALRERRPVVFNDYASYAHKHGLPEGHSPLLRLVSVPVIEGDKVVMLTGVGNKAQDYTDQDINTVQLISESIWRIVQRRRTQAKLRLQGAALDAAANVIVITDAKGTIEWVNDAFTRTTGYTSREAIGNNPRVLKSGQHPPEFYQELWRTISSGQVWHGEIHNQRKDGTPLEEEATITPVKDAAGVITHYIAIKQDITEKKAMEKQFLRAQRMESVGMLAGGIAHDLNNVLAPISMGLELLQQVPLPDKIRPVIDSMLTSTQRGAGIVKQVLTFARGTDGERAIVQLRHIIKDIRHMAEETFPRNITLHSDLAADLWPLKADASQLHQVLLNLSVNARDALPDGGQIHYSAHNLHLDEAAVLKHPGAKPGDYVLLKVTDTGTGMPPEVLDRIFEPFFTTKPHGQGTGLGLPTVLGIIRSHGGFLEVQSVPGKGTTFEVYLPADKSSATVAGPARTEPLRSGHGETILVVDDEPAVLAVTRSMLEGHGYRVLVAEDGAAAVAVYAQHAQQIAVVVTDIMMPLMDGVALIRSLQRLNSQVRIITVSGLSNQPGQPERHTELRSKGIRHHLNKPFSVEALLNALHEELHPAGPGN